MPHTQDARDARPAGFTTTELLVVIGIIVLLISLLIPVVGKVRDSARATNTASFIQQLAGVIESYHGDFKAYPGPLHNDQIYNSSFNAIEFIGAPGFAGATPDSGPMKITMSENLVLGLLGGLRWDTGNLQYVPSLVGNGPMSLNPATPKRYAPYIDATNLSWQEIDGGGGNRVKTGAYFDDASGPQGADDSIIPEFVDRFSDPLPILYLRAKVGANPEGANPNQNPVITNSNPSFGRPGQYDISQILAYTRTATDGSSIGVGKKAALPYYVDGSQVDAPRPYHGLNEVKTSRVLGPAGSPTYHYPFDGFAYFRDPALSNQQNVAGQGYRPPHVARQKDRFILISAGTDRIYGTNDDITNFGPVVP